MRSLFESAMSVSKSVSMVSMVTGATRLQGLLNKVHCTYKYVPVTASFTEITVSRYCLKFTR